MINEQEKEQLKIALQAHIGKEVCIELVDRETPVRGILKVVGDYIELSNVPLDTKKTIFVFWDTMRLLTVVEKK